MLFDYENYKAFLKAWIKQQPSKGRGELRRIAQFLRVHPTLLSHIVNGPKEFSNEQALEMANYLHLSRQECDYFLGLVQFSKAGSKNLQDYWAKKLAAMRVQSQDLSARFETKVEMTEAERGEFYSNWYYAAIHLAADLPHCKSLESIAELLGLPKPLVKEKADFLLRTGLCVMKDGRLQIGPAWTHVDSRSPHVASHHRNWRVKAMERYQELTESEFAVTAPVAVGKKDAMEFRKKAVQLIDDLKKVVSKSTSEELMVLNLDWVRFAGG